MRSLPRRSLSRRLLLVVTLVAAFAVGSSPDVRGASKARRVAPSLQTIGFDRAPLGTPWLDRTGYQPWWSLHDGFGVTSVVETAPGSRAMRLSTAAARTPSATYSALVRTTRTWGDLDFTIRLRTLAQRRRGQPNPWEVGWLLWRYTDNDHFYSFIIKPNGFELGKQDPPTPAASVPVYAYAPAFPVGRGTRCGCATSETGSRCGWTACGARTTLIANSRMARLHRPLRRGLDRALHPGPPRPPRAVVHISAVAQRASRSRAVSRTIKTPAKIAGQRSNATGARRVFRVSLPAYTRYFDRFDLAVRERRRIRLYVAKHSSRLVSQGDLASTSPSASPSSSHRQCFTAASGWGSYTLNFIPCAL